MKQQRGRHCQIPSRHSQRPHLSTLHRLNTLAAGPPKFSNESKAVHYSSSLPTVHDPAISLTTAGEGPIIMQHFQILWWCGHTAPNPRNQFRSNLTKHILQLRADGHGILLSMDATNLDRPDRKFDQPVYQNIRPSRPSLWKVPKSDCNPHQRTLPRCNHRIRLRLCQCDRHQSPWQHLLWILVWPCMSLYWPRPSHLQ